MNKVIGEKHKNAKVNPLNLKHQIVSYTACVSVKFEDREYKTYYKQFSSTVGAKQYS